MEIFPDFIRRCLILVDAIGEYQVAQKQDYSLTIAIEHRSQQREDEIVQQFQNLATDKSFLMPAIFFEDYQRDRGRKLKRIYRA